MLESKIIHKREKINCQSRNGCFATVKLDKYVSYSKVRQICILYCVLLNINIRHYKRALLMEGLHGRDRLKVGLTTLKFAGDMW